MKGDRSFVFITPTSCESWISAATTVKAGPLRRVGAQQVCKTLAILQRRQGIGGDRSTCSSSHSPRDLVIYGDARATLDSIVCQNQYMATPTDKDPAFDGS